MHTDRLSHASSKCSCLQLVLLLWRSMRTDMWLCIKLSLQFWVAHLLPILKIIKVNWKTWDEGKWERRGAGFQAWEIRVHPNYFKKKKEKNYWCTVAFAVPTASDRRTVVEVRSSRVPKDIHRHSLTFGGVQAGIRTTYWWVEPVLSHACRSLLTCYKIRWEGLWFDFWLSVPRSILDRDDIQLSSLLGFQYW